MKPAVIHKPLIKNIAFFGDSEIPENGKVYQDAFETAKLLAEKGFTIVNGGGDYDFERIEIYGTDR